MEKNLTRESTIGEARCLPINICHLFLALVARGIPFLSMDLDLGFLAFAPSPPSSGGLGLAFPAAPGEPKNGHRDRKQTTSCQGGEKLAVPPSSNLRIWSRTRPARSTHIDNGASPCQDRFFLSRWLLWLAIADLAHEDVRVSH